jgi:hypothetical protein
MWVIGLHCEASRLREDISHLISRIFQKRKHIISFPVRDRSPSIYPGYQRQAQRNQTSDHKNTGENKYHDQTERAEGSVIGIDEFDPPAEN